MMRLGILIVIGILWAVPGWAATVYPNDIAWPGTIATPSVARPNYRQTIVDPRWGTNVTRISGDEMNPSQAVELQHNYAKDQPWNADMTLIKLSGAVYIINDSDYTVFKHWNWHNDSRWSSVDPNILYYTTGSQFRKINVRTATSDSQSVLVHQFSGTIALGPNEGNISDGDGRVVFVIGSNTVVYDITTDTILATADLSAYATDWVTISQSGNYVIACSNTGGGARVYNTSLVYQRTIFSSCEHGDTAWDFAGNEVYAQTCGNQYSSLRDAAITSLTPSSCNAHLSGRNFHRHGWAYIDQFNVVYAKRLDSSNTVEIFAHHHSTQASYNSQCKAVVSPDGSKVMWNSDWGSGTVYAYVAEMPGNGGGSNSSPPSPPVGLVIQ